eukprot:1185576-Prorocentrum_minimum.AAC.2
MDCPSDTGDTQTDTTTCPVDCEGNWDTWSPCNGVTETRERPFVVSRSVKNKGRPCTFFGRVQTDDCHIDCIGGWGEWSACVAQNTRRKRMYTVSVGSKRGGAKCVHNHGAIQFDETTCPIDCVGEWTDWSSCVPNSKST